MAQEGMFWELVPEDAIEISAEPKSTDFVREWRGRKNKLERASRKPWTEFEYSPRMVKSREDALREFWEIFVDDRPLCRDACSKHANVQSEAVFSHAVTIMHEIYGWEG